MPRPNLKLFSKITNKYLYVTIACAAMLSTTIIHGENPAVIDATNSVEINFPLPDETPDNDPRETKDNSAQALRTPFGQLNWNDLAARIFTEKGKMYAMQKGMKLQLSLNPILQESLQRQLNIQRRISGAIVLIESSTGRIIALAEKRGDVANPLLTKNSIIVSARAPAASLMKIVTAAATIEKNNLDPNQDIYFNGGCKSLHNQNWLRDSNIDTQHLSFATAFGKSCNTPFARLAIYESGLDVFRDMTKKMMFNRPIPSDLLIETSAAFVPNSKNATPYDVGLVGAGFSASTLSPIHSAMLSAAVGSGGIIYAPRIVDAAFDNSGKEIYKASNINLGRAFSINTANKLTRLMQATIVGGTSRKYFRRKGTRNDIFDIGGKTGTLSDPETRQILYTWFSGIAPLDSADGVAIGTLIASPQNWVVRASSVAQSVLAQYLQTERQAARLASTKSHN